ncbi:ATP-binding cassette domain-containing protein [Microbacterium invictum]|uniref:Ribose transport system ATP-binding protein n=1 Tax=Microbacterium invictum TaxID=515415 RepID=A0AA40VMP1_9MICO|nr:sugar ABC transporter ATP-binding protein [Microbacterium invictum]MBB4139879.1 ribose transport system ATP-binding protein [Microbacterium invictum]
MDTPLLRITDLVKAFPGLTALDRVNLDVHAGEIVSVVGHNGSGKSTLVKILAGVYTSDGGSVDLARGTGVHFIHQDLALIDELTAAENLTLMQGDGAAALRPYRGRAKSAHARKSISRFGPPFDVDVPIRRLTPAQRAVVAISRALEGWEHSANVLVLDEPTESLHRSEVEVLFEAVRRLAAGGTGIIFVSHRLDEVLSLSDRIVVLRDGRKVADDPVADVDESRLITLITGSEALAARTRRGADHAASATPVVRIRGLRGGSVEHLDLDLHPGEIVGIAGVLGSGREAVPSLLYGASAGTADEFTVSGEPYESRSPARSLARGLAFVPGDRGRVGIVREMTARENLTLPQLKTLRGPAGSLSTRRERTESAQLLAEYDVRPPRTEQRIALFSGGNQQKIVMARALRDKPVVLLLDEPTQGVDIGAKATLYAAIEQGAAAGAAVVVSSSDAKELLTVCDRVVVMREGRVAAVLSGADLTEHRLVAEGYGLP